MFSAFRYRLYPKPGQEMRLNRSLLSLCDLYNDLKVEEMRRYREEHKSTSLTAFRVLALEARKHDEQLQDIHSQVVQNTGDRIHRSFRNFFEKRARFPKWKRSHRYNSLTFPQTGFKISLRRGLHLSGIGYGRIFVHRPLLGRVKHLTIKREADDEWYAIFVTERETPAKRLIAEIPANRIRGADVGLSKFITFDNGTSTNYPYFMRRSEDKIKRLQRRFSRKQKGSRRRRELGRRLARLHLHVGRQREDFQNKLVKQIFKENDGLILEKLNVAGMLRSHSLAKSISDSSWNSFARKAVFKANCSASTRSSSTPGAPLSSVTTAWLGCRRTWQKENTSAPDAASRFRETRTLLSSSKGLASLEARPRIGARHPQSKGLCPP